MSPNLRLYVRRRGRVGRWYGDFRAYADVGGAQEPLRAPGERLATTDQEEAWRLALRRLDELRALRRGEPVVVAAAPMPLGAYVTHHLHALRASGRVGAARLDTSALYLERALDFFGRERTVNSIRVKDVRGWAEAIGQRLGGKGGRAGERRPLSGASVRGHLFVLSKLFRRAVEEELVTVNPVAAMMDKPGRTVREAAYLEVPDAAVYLEAARTLPPLANNPDAMGAAFAYALIGTFLLTGGRMSEVLGLELEDVSFDRKTVTFRPNAWRGSRPAPRTGWCRSGRNWRRSSVRSCSGSDSRRAVGSCSRASARAARRCCGSRGSSWSGWLRGRGWRRATCGPRRSGTPTARRVSRRSTTGPR